MNIFNFLKKYGEFILSLLIIAFGSGNIYAQHLFSVNYNDLSQNNVNLIKSEVARFDASSSTMSLTRNHNNKDVYSFSLSSVQNTKIVILNEDTGNNVVITPTEEVSAQFELSPFFIEELIQSALGNADRYLIIETDADFSVRNVASVSAEIREVFIPSYFYGPKEDVKEALPKDRQIVHIFKEKPRLIPAFPDDPENLRILAYLEEEMNYYVYMYRLPDGTLCIYDEHFNKSTEKNEVSTGTRAAACCTNLEFNLTGILNNQQKEATEYAQNIWSAALVGTVPVDINVDLIPIVYNGNPLYILGQSYSMANYFDPVTQTWYSSSLGNQLAGYNVTPTLYDIKIEMNSNFNWNFLISSPPSSSQFDWITIMLHEIAHGLGFSTLIGSNGGYSYSTGGSFSYGTNYPGSYDRQLYQDATGNICITDLSQSDRATLVTSGRLYAGRPGSYLLAANGGSRVKMYAPSLWEAGSSVVHWDSSVTFSTFMKHTATYGFRLLTLGSRKIGIMRDIGWEITCPSTPAINFFNQIVTTNTTVTNCGDINVQNVKVQNGAKLILDSAAGVVNIISDFEVAFGSEFEIR